MKRYLSLWFPEWPLDRLRRARRAERTGSGRRPASPPSEPKLPFVLIEGGAKGLVLAAANAPARALGLTPGLGFTDAKARVPEIVSEDIDREADQRALAALAGWMVRYSPRVALDGIDGLMLETSGCDHLFGGEAAMAAQLSETLDREGIGHAIGLAGTPGAASALARGMGGSGPHMLAEGMEREGLADLCVSALRLSPEAETLLRRFGLTRIGQLYGVDRKALSRRFQSRDMADAVVLRLDQALGLRTEPLDPLRPAPAFSARLPCPEPLGATEGVSDGLRQLTEMLCAQLSTFGQGARAFAFHAFRSDGTVSGVEVSAARPVREPKHILRLFRERIDRIDPGFGIDLLLLEARRTGPMATSAVALSGDLAATDTDLAALSALADRINARLGEGATRIIRPAESHIPERAAREAAFAGDLPDVPAPCVLAGPRPLRLLARPEPLEVLASVPDGPPVRFVWRRVARRVVRADGPERIAPEWWRSLGPVPDAPAGGGMTRKWLSPKLDKRADAALIEASRRRLEEAERGEPVRNLPRARDYYRIEDEAGRRYWVFRRGLYDDGRGGPPEWFVHGLFA
ncbi:MAG: DNA polymerase Y family protein [Hyphomonas sp.]